MGQGKERPDSSHLPLAQQEQITHVSLLIGDCESQLKANQQVLSLGLISNTIVSAHPLDARETDFAQVHARDQQSIRADLVE